MEKVIVLAQNEDSVWHMTDEGREAYLSACRSFIQEAEKKHTKKSAFSLINEAGLSFLIRGVGLDTLKRYHGEMSERVTRDSIFFFLHHWLIVAGEGKAQTVARGLVSLGGGIEHSLASLLITHGPKETDYRRRGRALDFAEALLDVSA